MGINIKVNEKTSQQLTDLSSKRKAEHALNKSKQDIIAELVDKQHKKECK